jgi:hypothetical protein
MRSVKLFPSQTIGSVIFIGTVFFGLVVALAQFYPIGDDWFYTYNLAVKNFFQPYAHSDLAGFPWLLVALPLSQSKQAVPTMRTGCRQYFC